MLPVHISGSRDLTCLGQGRRDRSIACLAMTVVILGCSGDLVRRPIHNSWSGAVRGYQVVLPRFDNRGSDNGRDGDDECSDGSKYGNNRE